MAGRRGDPDAEVIRVGVAAGGAGGGFAPFGAHGVFAALPVGVVFALQGFEQAIQVGGEARDPQRDISRAVIVAMLIGTVVYVLLEIAVIGGLNPHDLAGGWKNPVPKDDFGPYATIAAGAGASWLAYILYADAFVSPAGTGLVYLGTSSRLSYAMARQRGLPSALATVTDAIVLGHLLFAAHRLSARRRDPASLDWRNAGWVLPWLVGMTLIGYLGRYGAGARDLLPNWVDLAVVGCFALAVFYIAGNDLEVRRRSGRQVVM